MSAATTSARAAEAAGGLWGTRAADWATEEVVETPKYEAALARLDVSPGDSVLDVGCGSGVFLRLAADRGARVSGLDASERLLEIARTRVPDADLRVGDLQSLPWADDSFDLVTGFNSFFFAADMSAALREAGRVAKPGAKVLIQVWGRPERCELTPILQAIRSFRPSPPPRVPLSAPGALERLATEAGLTPGTAFDFSFANVYADREALLRAVLSPGPVVEAMAHAGEQAVTRAVAEAAEPYRTEDGGYRLENEWHYLIATA